MYMNPSALVTNKKTRKWYKPLHNLTINKLFNLIYGHMCINTSYENVQF